MLLVCLVVLCSQQGKIFEKEMESASKKHLEKDEDMKSHMLAAYVQLLEYLILFENFCCQKKFRKRDIKVLKEYIPMFLDHYKRVVNRTKGAEMKFVKFHFPLHLADDILGYGPPQGYNGGPGESHHKMEAKDPAKHTQRRTDTFELQMASRVWENIAISWAHGMVNDHSSADEKVVQEVQYCGSQYFVDCQGLWEKVRKKKRAMQWYDSSMHNVIVNCIQNDLLPHVNGD